MPSWSFLIGVVVGLVVWTFMATTWSSSTHPDLELLVDVVCAECRTCDRAERAAVAHLALRRVAEPGWGDTLSDVLLADGQFALPVSRWCRAELPASDAPGGVWSPSMVARHAEWMKALRRQMAAVLSGDEPDPLADEAPTHFHARWVCRRTDRGCPDGTLWNPPLYTEIAVPDDWRHRFFRLADALAGS